MLPARPASVSIPAQVGRFIRSLAAGDLVKLWVEEWIGTPLRPIPGLLGFTLRYLLYRFLFKELGGFCFIYPGARLTHTYGIRAGRNFRVNGGAFLDGRGGLTVGSDVLVGPNAVILSSEHRWDDPARPIVVQGHRLAPVTVGDDVWIGGNVVVTPGVTIASGTVVGAGAVVTGDTTPYSIVAGVPARPMGERPRPA